MLRRLSLAWKLLSISSMAALLALIVGTVPAAAARNPDPVGFSITPAVTVTEGVDAHARIDITRSGANTYTKNVTVLFSTATDTDVTAAQRATSGTSNTAPADYENYSNYQLTFSPTEYSKSVDVTIYPNTLSEGTEYFKVQIAGYKGSKIASGTGVVTILEDPLPTAITNLAVTTPNSFELLLSWTASTNAASYEVYMTDVQGTYGSVLGSATTNSYHVYCFLPNHHYYFEVKPLNAEGASPTPSPGMSNETGLTTPYNLVWDGGFECSGLSGWSGSGWTRDHSQYYSGLTSGEVYASAGATGTLTQTISQPANSSPTLDFHYRLHLANTGDSALILFYVNEYPYAGGQLTASNTTQDEWHDTWITLPYTSTGQSFRVELQVHSNSTTGGTSSLWVDDFVALVS